MICFGHYKNYLFVVTGFQILTLLVPTPGFYTVQNVDFLSDDDDDDDDYEDDDDDDGDDDKL